MVTSAVPYDFWASCVCVCLLAITLHIHNITDSSNSPVINNIHGGTLYSWKKKYYITSVTHEATENITMNVQRSELTTQKLLYH